VPESPLGRARPQTIVSQPTHWLVRNIRRKAKKQLGDWIMSWIAGAELLAFGFLLHIDYDANPCEIVFYLARALLLLGVALLLVNTTASITSRFRVFLLLRLCSRLGGSRLCASFHRVCGRARLSSDVSEIRNRDAQRWPPQPRRCSPRFYQPQGPSPTYKSNNAVIDGVLPSHLVWTIELECKPLIRRFRCSLRCHNTTPRFI
jgi:hypothetical protein